MRRLIFEGIIAFAVLAFMAIGAKAEEGCHIDSNIWFTTGYPEKDDNLCRFEWAVREIQCVEAEIGSGGKPIYMAIVDLIGEDDPRLETLRMRPDSNAQVWADGHWSGMQTYEEKILARGCIQPNG